MADLKSKFGTLVKFREEFTLGDSIRLQWGRSCFDFLVQFEEKTTQQIINEERINIPKFMTRAQLKERGELHDD